MTAFGLTDIGKERKVNQDAFALEVFEEDNLAFFIVCDGMGGVKGGEVASSISVRVIEEEFKLNIKPTIRISQIKEMIGRGIKWQNAAVYAKAIVEQAL